MPVLVLAIKTKDRPRQMKAIHAAERLGAAANPSFPPWRNSLTNPNCWSRCWPPCTKSARRRNKLFQHFSHAYALPRRTSRRRSASCWFASVPHPYQRSRASCETRTSKHVASPLFCCPISARPRKRPCPRCCSPSRMPIRKCDGEPPIRSKRSAPMRGRGAGPHREPVRLSQRGSQRGCPRSGAHRPIRQGGPFSADGMPHGPALRGALRRYTRHWPNRSQVHRGGAGLARSDARSVSGCVPWPPSTRWPTSITRGSTLRCPSSSCESATVSAGYSASRRWKVCGIWAVPKRLD